MLSSSQWDMAFSVDPSAVTTNSPPMNLNSTVQDVHQPLTAHYPIQYDSPTKMAPVTPAPAMSQAQPQFNPRHSIITAREWQQSVASVFDPHGLKRRWNNYSVDMGMENTAKRQRWKGRAANQVHPPVTNILFYTRFDISLFFFPATFLTGVSHQLFFDEHRTDDVNELRFCYSESGRCHGGCTYNFFLSNMFGHFLLLFSVFASSLL